MRVVVQLERIGDIVQSIPAARAAVADDLPCALLVREGLGAWARLLVPAGMDVLEFPDAVLSRVRAELARNRRSEAVLEAAGAACGVLGGESPTSVVSLTWNAAGAAVAAALAGPSAERSGPMRGPDGRTACPDFWALYPVAAVDGRPGGRVHMTDVRRLIVEDSLERRLGAHDLAPLRRDSTLDGIAILVTGASDTARVWPVEHFARVAVELAALGLAPVLAGGPADVERAAAIERASRGAARSLAGRLAPSGLAALVGEARLVIGADTGPVHLASWLGAPTVMMMSGRAHVWETGPVRPGDIALQALPIGRSAIEAIDPGLVLASARALLDGGDVPGGTGSAEVWTARSAGPSDPLGGTIYGMPGLEGEHHAARSLLARLAGAPGRHGAPDFTLSAGSAKGAQGAACAARAHAAAALDESARGRGTSCAGEISRAVAELGRAAEQVSAEEGLAAVAAMIRLLAEEAADTSPARCASRLAALALDLENALDGAPAPGRSVVTAPRA